MKRASQEELNNIKFVMNAEKKARVFKRYQSLYLFLSGKPCREVAKIVGVSKDTVSNIRKKYRNEGLNGIPDKPISGRHPRLNDNKEPHLKR